MRLPHSQSQRNSIMQTPVLLLAAVHAALALLSCRERLWADVRQAQLPRGLIDYPMMLDCPHEDSTLSLEGCLHVSAVWSYAGLQTR